MEIKFKQTKHLYDGNEYKNMPSIGRGCGQRLTTKSNKVIDWQLVDQIVKKYGFRYCLIQSTFGSYGERGVYETDFVLYYKTDISNDWFQQKRKNQEWEVLQEQGRRFADICFKMHDCVHELDEMTELGFNTCWVGNVGLFGSDDVRRTSYSGGSGLSTWESITNWRSPLIHNTELKLSKGVYIMMYSGYLKSRDQV